MWQLESQYCTIRRSHSNRSKHEEKFVDKNQPRYEPDIGSQWQYYWHSCRCSLGRPHREQTITTTHIMIIQSQQFVKLLAKIVHCYSDIIIKIKPILYWLKQEKTWYAHRCLLHRLLETCEIIKYYKWLWDTRTSLVALRELVFTPVVFD